jgi:hypothetical protein
MTQVPDCEARLCLPWVPELCSIAMKTRLLLLALCLPAFLAQAQDAQVQMWMWKDANGVVHYSDVPGPGAVKVGISVSPSQPDAESPAQDASSVSAAPEPAQVTNYGSLQIVSPENEASYFAADSVVEVQIETDPPLMDGDSLFLYLDGNRVGNSGDATSYSLSSIDRGAHTLVAAIFDAQGKQKIRSPQVVFFMKQTTIKSPDAVGPKLKPPPRPRPNPN